MEVLREGYTRIFQTGPTRIICGRAVAQPIWSALQEQCSVCKQVEVGNKQVASGPKKKCMKD